MNGFHDAANSIATVVSTGVLKPQQAVVFAAFFNFLAIFIFHLSVAATVGKGIVHPAAVDLHVIFGALVGAIVWNVITWYYGIPSSSSHALFGGLIGAGLAGTEAAWQIASAGVPVRLVEMRPVRRSPAHHSSEFAELVCSNSFGALSSDRAAGLLQEELRRLGSLVIRTADAHAVPAGGALAVDRGRYSAALTAALERHPLVSVERREHTALPEPGEVAVLATGP